MNTQKTILIAGLLFSIFTLGCSAELGKKIDDDQGVENITITSADVIVVNCTQNGKTYKAGELLPNDQIANTENTLHLFQKQNSEFLLSVAPDNDSEQIKCEKLALVCGSKGAFETIKVESVCEKSCDYRGKKYPMNSLIDIVSSISLKDKCSHLQYITCSTDGEITSNSTEKY